MELYQGGYGVGSSVEPARCADPVVLTNGYRYYRFVVIASAVTRGRRPKTAVNPSTQLESELATRGVLQFFLELLRSGCQACCSWTSGLTIFWSRWPCINRKWWILARSPKGSLVVGSCTIINTSICLAIENIVDISSKEESPDWLIVGPRWSYRDDGLVLP